MKVSICPKCKTKEIIQDLEKLNIDLKLECINFCGVGRNKYVAIIDHKPIICEDKDRFIQEINNIQKNI